MNVIHVVCMTVGGLVVMAATSILVWVLLDWKKQKVLVDGLNYRRKNGAFDLAKYAQGYVVATVPNRQNNSGPDPETYDRKISYVDHFDNLSYLTTEKRNEK